MLMPVNISCLASPRDINQSRIDPTNLEVNSRKIASELKLGFALCRSTQALSSSIRSLLLWIGTSSKVNQGPPLGRFSC